MERWARGKQTKKTPALLEKTSLSSEQHDVNSKTDFKTYPGSLENYSAVFSAFRTCDFNHFMHLINLRALSLAKKATDSAISSS